MTNHRAKAFERARMKKVGRLSVGRIEDLFGGIINKYGGNSDEATIITGEAPSKFTINFTLSDGKIDKDAMLRDLEYILKDRRYTDYSIALSQSEDKYRIVVVLDKKYRQGES